MPSQATIDCDPNVSIVELFDALRESAVLEDTEVDELWNHLQGNDSWPEAEDFAAGLVESGRLTQYQATALLAGRGQALVLGHYLILHEIGKGGMGQVFKARHRRMKREVALKVLSSAITQTPDAVKRFQREAEAAAKLAHPNIVAAHDAGEHQGIHYLVMEYVAGDDLANLVKKYGPLRAPQALSYVAQAARGLGHAHRRGVIHRDIKPANLLLDLQGTVKILDMGIARLDRPALGERAEELTQTGNLMGTVDYMSPEQALDTKTADARADIYSLGCTLYYLLTGRPPYEGDTLMKRLVAHRDEPIPPLTAMRSDLPSLLPAVFERMVAKRAADRFQTMDQVNEALAACVAGLGSTCGDAGTCLELPDSERWKLDFADMPTESASATLSMRPTPGAGTPGTKALNLRTWLGILAVAALAIFAGWLLKNRPAAESPKKFFTSLPESNTPQPAAPEPATPASRKADLGRAAGEVLENSLDMKLVYVAPGEFNMGSLGSGPQDVERLHQVKLTKGFYLGMHEVTQMEYQRVMKSNPSWFSRAGAGGGALSGVDPGRLPVESVTWDEACEFCRRLSALPAEAAEGRTYRLPTEAEWEFACRAGSSGNYHFGDSLNGEAANCLGTAPYGTTVPGPNLARTTPVGSYSPNVLGLHDMHGNVWEWCADWYDAYPSKAVDPHGPETGDQRVIRGGSWLYIPFYCRSASRSSFAATVRSFDGGFRVACEVTP